MFIFTAHMIYKNINNSGLHMEFSDFLGYVEFIMETTNYFGRMVDVKRFRYLEPVKTSENGHSMFGHQTGILVGVQGSGLFAFSCMGRGVDEQLLGR